MKICRIAAYRVELPLREGSYQWAGGKSVSVLDSTIVRVDTDEGVTGYGEVCPLGPCDLPAYAAGARAGIAQLAPHLIGRDPTQLWRLGRVMDAALEGQPYVKSPIDMACWDILGQVTRQPLCHLLGGRYGDDFVLCRPVSQQAPGEMARKVVAYRVEGYRRFQVKVGGDPDMDIERIHAVADKLQPGDKLVADADAGWTAHEAIRVVRAVGSADVYVEQPCAGYEPCLSIRRRTDLPFILDESIDGIGALLRAAGDRAMDVVNLKISRFGGLTGARQARDLCVSLGIAVSVEDSWAGDIATAAIAHLAQSTPPEFLFAATDFNSYVTVSTAEGAPQRAEGRMAASAEPGLGIAPRMDVLGAPVLEVS